MKSSNRRWFPVIAILCASSVCLTGCKSSSWSQLPGMSYFTSNEKPEQAYYGQQETPSSDYNASTVDYSQRYGNNDSANAQNTYGQQYESTNVGNTNYLNSQPQQQVTGQPQQLYGQQQYGNQAATYPAQATQPSPTQQQPYPPQGQNLNVAGQTQPNSYQPQRQSGLTNSNIPTAGTLQDTAGNYNGGGFYNPNANAGTYQPNAGAGTAAAVPTYGGTGTTQPQGAAAYISEAPTNTQFDGGNYQPNGGNFQPNGSTINPMPAYRPGSTGGTNSYYTPNGGTLNGQ